MSKRRKTIIILSIMGLLIVGAILSIQIYNSRNIKEKEAAKSFIELLYNNDMIDRTEEKDDIKYNTKKQSDGVKEYYEVTTKNFTINLDSNFKVIGFNNYKIEIKDTQISEKSAREFAEKYISNLSKEDYKFKETIKEGDTKLNCYSYIFTRYKEGQPFYSDQILIKIDKIKGYLEGYSNTTLQGEPKKVNIIIEQGSAEGNAIISFNEKNKSGRVLPNTTYKAFCDTKDKTVTELCYVVTVIGVDEEKKEVRFKYFISTETGELINSIKDNVSNTVS